MIVTLPTQASTMFRVTHQNLLRSTHVESARSHAEILRLQAQISSGNRIQRPSDDPVGHTAVRSQRSLVARLETKIVGIESIRSRTRTAYQAVIDAQGIFVRAKAIALEGRQETDPQGREVLAREVGSLLTQLQTIANTQIDGTAVFAGAASPGKAFQFSEEGAITAYIGSNLPGVGAIDGEPSPITQPPGTAVFQSTDPETLLFTGNTGAAIGAGTSSIRGVRELQVTWTATMFAGASGVQSGASATEDTVLGPAGSHMLSIRDTSGTGATGVVSLNGGPDIAFSSADTNLVVTGPNGEAIHIDTTAITPGFDGVVDVTGEGTLSINGGQTNLPIDFSSNQIVVDARDGSVLHVDTTNIRRAGVERIDAAGTADAFQVLSQLRDELRNSPALSSADRDGALSRRLDDIDRISTHLLGVVSEQSITLERLDHVQSRTELLLLDARGRLSEVEETDYPQAILELQSHQLRMQVSLATAARMFDVSLLNFIS